MIIRVRVEALATVDDGGARSVASGKPPAEHVRVHWELILSGVTPDVDAVTTEPVRALRWDVATLEKYLAANPETRSVMQRHLVRDLAGKVERLSKTREIKN